MSCVVSVVGICSSDVGLRISPSQNAQTPPNDKHYGHGDPCLILKFLIRFNRAAPANPDKHSFVSIHFYLLAQLTFSTIEQTADVGPVAPDDKETEKAGH